MTERHDDLARLRANVERVRARIHAACEEAGRDPDGIAWVGITKYRGAGVARALVEAGVSDLGENRVDHLLQLSEALAQERVRWHMVGHLQRNKAKKVADVISVLHSLDSLELAQVLERRRDPNLPPIQAYAQIRLAEVEGRSGTDEPALQELVASLAGLSRVQLVGLMGLPPEGEPEEARRHFQYLAELRARVQTWPGGAGCVGLSMGMTADLEVAIQEGATVVRIGRALLEGLSPEWE